MFYLCICDDNDSDLQNVKNRISFYVESRALHGEIAIISYSSSRELWFHLCDHKASTSDIYVLDIEMPGIDGMELAHSIRSRKPDAIILFLSSHSEYASQGYLVGAIRYILKSAEPTAFYEALDAAITEMRSRSTDCLTVVHHRDILNIPFSEIIFIERVGRIIYIHTRTEKTYEDNRTLQEIQKLLSSPGFILIDRGTILNTNYIQQTEGNHIHMFNGIVFTISKRRLMETKRAIAEAWTQRSKLL